MNMQPRKPIAGQSNTILLDPLSGSASLGRRRAIERFTVTLPLILAAALGAQVSVAYWLGRSPFENPPNLYSIIAALAVHFTAIVTYREFRRTPGTKRFSLLLTSYALPLLLLAAVLLGLRIPYSNYVLLTGLGTGFAALILFSALQRPVAGRTLYFVPGEVTAKIQAELEALPNQVIECPKDLSRCRNGVVVVDLRQDLSSEWERAIAHAVVQGVAVYNAKQVREAITGKVQIETLSENSFGALVPSHSYFLVKRTMDVIVSGLALVALAIPMALIVLAIRLTSPGPAIFRHRRRGFRGRIFETLKFRTMIVRPRDDDDLEGQKTVDGDTRITPVGRLLRKTRLDELPQLINVLRGEMSLIGPRPEAMALSAWYDQHLDFYEYRHVVRPGITGWAQVNQGHVTELEDVYTKLQYDFYYIKNISAWLDLLIALRTLAVMVHFRGAR